MSKVGIIGIDLVNLPNLKGRVALNASGNNFGNMLFTNAAYQQVKGAEHIGFNWNPDKVNEEFSSVFIPAANWINTKQDWGWLAELIEKTDLPCVVVGLGSQINSLADVENIPSGTKRFLSVISERGAGVGVRGSFTADVLNSCGVKNADVLGCPSIFSSGTSPKLREIRLDEINHVGVGPTRYVIDDVNDSNRLDKQRQLYQYAIRHASSIYYQSEQYEIEVLSREDGKNSDEHMKATKYYGLCDSKQLKSALLRKGKYHTSLPSWLTDVRKDDIYIGTRIHGAVAATLAGTPPILITHDNRTRELAEEMAVPSISLDNFELSYLYDLPDFVARFDYEKYQRRTDYNLKKLMQFYKRNKLENNLYLESE
ncbi:polysaccharide pyruvyl transferase family protein [Vibrio parahaemolyticus]|nr:polysaccharide pyruvyl transferase family protein [Vibrio parahaemolyticus]